MRASLASHSHQHLILSYCLDFGHSNRDAIVSCCFNLHFPGDICCGASFYMLICRLYIFLIRFSLRSLTIF